MKNPHETAAREKKAKHLIALLLRYRFTREHIERMNNKDWAVAAHAAGVNHPSNATIEMVKEEWNRRASHDLADVPPIG